MRAAWRVPVFLVITAIIFQIQSRPSGLPPKNITAAKLAGTSWLIEGETGSMKFHKGNRCEYIDHSPDAPLAGKKQNCTYSVRANRVIILWGDGTARARQQTILQYYETANQKFLDRRDSDPIDPFALHR